MPDRVALAGILFVLRTGIQWRDVPAEMGCSGKTCWRWLVEWHSAGVWRALHRALLERLRGADRLDWSRASLDSAAVRAKGGGEETGPNPTDRGKAGTKRHLVVDGEGTPLGLTISEANRHDSRMMASTLDVVPPVGGQRGRPRQRPHKLHAGPTHRVGRDTTTAGAAASAVPGASSHASQGAGSTDPSGSGVTAGKSSAPSLGLPSSAASSSATNAARTSTWHSPRSRPPSSACVRSGGFVPNP